MLLSLDDRTLLSIFSLVNFLKNKLICIDLAPPKLDVAVSEIQIICYKICIYINNFYYICNLGNGYNEFLEIALITLHGQYYGKNTSRQHWRLLFL